MKLRDVFSKFRIRWPGVITPPGPADWEPFFAELRARRDAKRRKLEEEEQELKAKLEAEVKGSTYRLRLTRDVYEEGLTPVCLVLQPVIREGSIENALLAVLQKDDGQPDLYWCHRYYKEGDDWACSVDAEEVPLPIVWGWLTEPRKIEL